MTTINKPFLNTDKLNQFALFLRKEANKITDALFVENLINAIVSHPGANKDCVDRWLKSAFAFPSNCNNDNIQDVYNRSFYHSILETGTNTICILKLKDKLHFKQNKHESN